jgi:hypothetical protein
MGFEETAPLCAGIVIRQFDSANAPPTPSLENP